jgi:hypothetical protein
LNVHALGIQPPGPQRAQHAATEHSTDQPEAVAARRRLRQNTSGTIQNVAHDVRLLRIQKMSADPRPRRLLGNYNRTAAQYDRLFFIYLNPSGKWVLVGISRETFVGHGPARPIAK